MAMVLWSESFAHVLEMDDAFLRLRNADGSVPHDELLRELERTLIAAEESLETDPSPFPDDVAYVQATRQIMGPIFRDLPHNSVAAAEEAAGAGAGTRSHGLDERRAACHVGMGGGVLERAMAATFLLERDNSCSSARATAAFLSNLTERPTIDSAVT